MQQVLQFRTLACVSLMLVVLSAVKFCRADASDIDSSIADGGRHKRGPTVGLFAFPRVGRSDPDLLEWSDAAAVAAALPLELADDYEDYPIREAKRQGLVPFPRVGRSGSGVSNAARFYWPKTMMQLQKRAGNSGANSGMWFGPRLGKRASAASTEIKGTEVYTPRLGRNLDAGDLNAQSSSSTNSKPEDFERLFQTSDN
ncbi:cardio acceleratory peptide 2b isoform X1 [Aedes albopictus]|uniref:Cardio acceleratory peptide 2b n=1 Tax=Aedes albopictus TaxID=7160 RepID=A0ABM1Y9T7_AEDAL|nr:cardio acceleratory peptide 2b-like isoform X1 [Aedes albopictus]